MTTDAPSPGYHAYLLRCWQASSQVTADLRSWRFSLEDPHTDTRYGFATFDALIAFLHNQLRADPCRSEGTPVDEQAS